MERRQPQDLPTLVAKLLHETGRLRRDVIALHERIEPIEPAGDPSETSVPRFQITTEAQARSAIAEARNSIQGSELHLNAIRALLSMIEGGAESREELRQWIKAKKN